MTYGDAALLAMEKLAKCLSDTVSNAVAEGVLQTNLCRCSIVPGGTISQEFVGNNRCADNGTDGQGFVFGTGAYPSQRFPEPFLGNGACNSADLAFNVNVGIIRTYPVDEGGEPFSEEDMIALTTNQYIEMGLIHQVLTCCWSDASEASLIVGSYLPIGPEGLAIGGYWSATLELGTDT